jgi:hypothetical protein
MGSVLASIVLDRLFDLRVAQIKHYTIVFAASPLGISGINEKCNNNDNINSLWEHLLTLCWRPFSFYDGWKESLKTIKWKVILCSKNMSPYLLKCQV